MEINVYIELESDRENWKKFLLEKTKEELVDLMLDKMARDPSLSKKIYYQLINWTPSADDKIKGYQEAVENEMEAKIPDVDFLEIVSRKIMDYAASEDDLFDRIKLYISVIRTLDNSIINGAGYEKDDEFILVDLMDKCRNSMLTDIESKYKELSAEDFGNIYDLLKSESLNDDLLDGANRVGEVFKKLASLTKGRTRVTKDGAYVRGVDFYKKNIDN